jgi:hypothetical protein
LLIAAKASGWSRAAEAPNKEASPTGALDTIAHGTGGVLLMWLLAVGMLMYAAWRVVSAMLPGPNGAKASIVRLGYLASAIIYLTFAFTAFSLARSKRSSANGNRKVTLLSAKIMDHSGGRLLIGVAGAIVIAAGLYHVIKGLHMDVDDELDLSGMSPSRLTWTRRLGAIGEIGRGAGIGLVGFFLLRAALTYEASEATGLDGALRRLASQSWGVIVVLLIAIGFVAYGVFCLATFTRRRLQAPS